MPYKNIHFIDFDLPTRLKWWKKGGGGVHLYYFLWQIGICFFAKKLSKRILFDVIHHVTFVSVRQPSFLGLLGVPFIFGPVAGGERAPMFLRKNFPLRGWLTDAFRDLVNQWVRFSPLMRLTFSRAKAIYVTSEQTWALMPKRFQEKTFGKLAIGADERQVKTIKSFEQDRPIRVLYVGHLLYLKGVHLALRVFSVLLKQLPVARFTILGKGADAQWFRNLSNQLGIDHAIDWLAGCPETRSIWCINVMIFSCSPVCVTQVEWWCLKRCKTPCR